jgi:hypothetical protein
VREFDRPSPYATKHGELVREAGNPLLPGAPRLPPDGVLARLAHMRVPARGRVPLAVTVLRQIPTASAPRPMVGGRPNAGRHGALDFAGYRPSPAERSQREAAGSPVHRSVSKLEIGFAAVHCTCVIDLRHMTQQTLRTSAQVLIHVAGHIDVHFGPEIPASAIADHGHWPRKRRPVGRAAMQGPDVPDHHVAQFHFYRLQRPGAGPVCDQRFIRPHSMRAERGFERTVRALRRTEES